MFNRPRSDSDRFHSRPSILLLLALGFLFLTSSAMMLDCSLNIVMQTPEIESELDEKFAVSIKMGNNHLELQCDSLDPNTPHPVPSETPIQLSTRAPPMKTTAPVSPHNFEVGEPSSLDVQGENHFSQ